MAVLVCLSLAACGHKADPGAPSPEPSSTSAPKPPPFPGKPTSALIQRAEVAALVDALAKEKTLESSHIGAGGSPSQVYAKFVAIEKAATEAEMIALLQHESPLVRGYVAQHVARDAPARMDALVPLADDATGVETRNGCMGGFESVAEIVLQALCYSRAPEAGRTLGTIAQKGGRSAPRALACAAPWDPKTSAAMAVKALGAEGKPDDEISYLNALAIAPAADPKEACALARGRAKSKDASLQIAASNALWWCSDEASRGALEGLASDKNDVVARYAKVSLFLSVPDRREMLGTDPQVVSEAAERLSKVLRSVEGTRGSLALVETLSIAYPMRFGGAFQEVAITPETTALALRLAAKLEPSAAEVWGAVRGGVIGYLARAKEPAALPEMRRSLASGDPIEIAAALHGVLALKDTASRAAVEKLTSHTSRYVRDTAKETLAAL